MVKVSGSEIEKEPERLNASLEWFIERIGLRKEEIVAIGENQEMESCYKKDALGEEYKGHHRVCRRSGCAHSHAPLR